MSYTQKLLSTKTSNSNLTYILTMQRKKTLCKYKKGKRFIIILSCV